MSSYDGAEICELFGVLALSTLANSIPNTNSGLYRNVGLILVRNGNRKQQTESERRQLKHSNRTVSNLKVVYFLDITNNLSNSTYKSYRISNDKLFYLNISSNLSPPSY